MSEADRKKWDARYAAGSHGERLPSRVLAEHIGLISPGPALDVACGAGRNALFMARRGFTVDAVDISPVGLQLGRDAAAAAGLSIAWHCIDLLDHAQLPGSAYNLILMCHFVSTPLLAQLPALLADGGLLLVEQHLQWPHPVAAGLAGPGSACFRLAPGELLTQVQQAGPQLEIVTAVEGLMPGQAETQVAVAQVVARNTARSY
jgi:SAM-dependent methyltransferase